MEDVLMILTFGLMIYIMFAMPTKREVRRLANQDAEARRQRGLRELLRSRAGTVCKLSLGEMHGAIGAAAIEGEVLDVDDAWALVRVTGKKGSRLTAVRLDEIEGVEETMHGR